MNIKEMLTNHLWSINQVSKNNQYYLLFEETGELSFSIELYVIIEKKDKRTLVQEKVYGYIKELAELHLYSLILFKMFDKGLSQFQLENRY